MNPSARFKFLHGTQNQSELAFEEEIKELTPKDNFSYSISFSDDGKKISIEDLKEASNGVKETDFYICGPRGMMQSLYAELKGWGVMTKNIHYEYFGPKGTIEA